MSMPHWLDALTPPLQNHLDRLAETTGLILARAGVDQPTPPGRQTTATPPPARPQTTSRDIARGIGRWVKGGTESPTLAAVFVARSDTVATSALIAVFVIAISILAQVRVGPLWLQPLAVLLTGAVLGSRGGGLAATIYVAIGILGLPVFAPGVSAWTSVNFRAPYVRYGLGYLVGLTAAAFAVGWLCERRLWDRHRAGAARLALAGITLHVRAWIHLARDVRPCSCANSAGPRVCCRRSQCSSLPSPFWRSVCHVRGLGVASMQHAASESESRELPPESTPPGTTHTNPPR